MYPADAVRPKFQSSSGTWYPAGRLPAVNAALGVAPYFVTLAIQRPADRAVVTEALTGKVLAVLHPPAGGTRFIGVAAAGDDHTFVLAAQEPNASAARFYELRLGPSGHPAPLVLLPVAAVPYDGAFAVSAHSSKLAIATATGNIAAIEIVSLATGAVRLWKAARGRVSDLSWAGDRLLATQWCSPPWSRAGRRIPRPK